MSSKSRVMNLSISVFEYKTSNLSSFVFRYGKPLENHNLGTKNCG